MTASTASVSTVSTSPSSAPTTRTGSKAWRRRWSPRVLPTLLAITTALLAWHAWQWQRARDVQAAVHRAATTSVPEAAVSTAAASRAEVDVRVVVAQATRLRTLGRHDEAVRVLQALAARGDLDAPTMQVVRFNLGNALLALALQHNKKDDEDRAMTLVELAKQRLREVLRLEPQHWDARHNLDLALRLAPETEPPPPPEKAKNVQRIQVDLRGMRGVDLP